MSNSATRPAILLRAIVSFLALPLVASTFEPASAAQQQVLLQGVVADEATGEVIAAATVTLVGKGIETRTSADGIFAFPDVPLGRVSVRVQAPGYPAVVEEVEVTAGAVVFMQVLLPSVQAVLRELVVVGKATDPTSLGDARTAADLLARQVPGINASSGVVGRNTAPVLPRGVSSFNLSSEPAVFLDGVRMSGGLGRALEVLSQIPAAHVKEIRILRGPSSAFLQGSATGVIYVETRSGPGEGG